MRLSLFSRLTIDYLTIFLIVALASAYAVLQLREFRDLTQSILKVDTRLLDHEKNLADLLLAQSRAEQKFAITKDEAWYLQFVRLKIDFEGRLQMSLGCCFSFCVRAKGLRLSPLREHSQQFAIQIDQGVNDIVQLRLAVPSVRRATLATIGLQRPTPQDVMLLSR